jgi:hypothetical protein
MLCTEPDMCEAWSCTVLLCCSPAQASHTLGIYQVLSSCNSQSTLAAQVLGWESVVSTHTSLMALTVTQCACSRCSANEGVGEPLQLAHDAHHILLLMQAPSAWDVVCMLWLQEARGPCCQLSVTRTWALLTPLLGRCLPSATTWR